MAKNINDRLLEELIKNKHVTYRQDLFTKYYDTIFPCPKDFEQFLAPNNQDMTVEAAKRVMKRMLYDMKCPAPLKFTANHVAIERSTLDASDTFFAQDHYIHSVYIYLVGIYVFFNHQSIHAAVFWQISDQILPPKTAIPRSHATVAAFIKNMKYFSLFHDIGYVFERQFIGTGSVNPNIHVDFGLLNEYNEQEKLISHDISMRIMARVTLYSYIAELSNETMEDFMTNYFGCKAFEGEDWKSIDEENDNHVSKYEIHDLLVSKATYNRLWAISSADMFCQISPFTNMNEMVIIIVDADLTPCAIQHREAGGSCGLYRSSKCSELRKESNDILDWCGEDFLPYGYSCVYFVPEPKKQFIDWVNKDFLSVYASDLPNALKSIHAEKGDLLSFVTRGTKLQDVSYELYDYFSTVYTTANLELSISERWETCHKEIVKKMIKDTVMATIEDCLASSDFMTDDIDQSIKQATAYAENSMHDADIAKLINGIRKEYDSKTLPEGIIAECIWKIYKVVETDATKLSPSWLLDPINKTAAHDPFHVRYAKEKRALAAVGNITDNDEKDELQHLDVLIDYFEQELKKTGFLSDTQKIDEFLVFRRFFAPFDHGITSASILADAMLTHHSLAKRSEVYLASNWIVDGKEVSESIEEEQINLRPSLFAILIHNIHAGDYYTQVKNKYMQSLQGNAFSYLCALCDGLQFWNRDHVTNQGYHTAPFSYYGNDCDIKIDGNIICLRCKSPDVYKTIETQRDQLSQFLQSASSLIRFEIEEVK